MTIQFDRLIEIDRLFACEFNGSKLNLAFLDESI